MIQLKTIAWMKSKCPMDSYKYEKLKEKYDRVISFQCVIWTLQDELKRKWEQVLVSHNGPDDHLARLNDEHLDPIRLAYEDQLTVLKTERNRIADQLGDIETEVRAQMEEEAMDEDWPKERKEHDPRHLVFVPSELGPGHFKVEAEK